LEKDMQPRSGNPALQNGLRSGMILGIVEIVLTYLLGGVGLIISILLFLCIAGYAGYRASTRTGKVSTGLLAGLLAGLFSSVIATIPLLIYYLSNIDALRTLLQQQMPANNLSQGITLTNNLVIASVILFLVLLVAVATLLGLGAGSIGGAIGKGQAPPAPVPRPPSFILPYPPQRYTPPPPQVYQPSTPPRDYTSPEAYMTPQENTPPTPPPESGPFQ
jgi:hypothetical protein